jgi:PAS domain S-box-containing protein
VLGISHDITDRKQAEESLRESEERMRAIFESVQDFIFVKDENRRYLSINNFFQRRFDVDPSVFLGYTDAEIPIFENKDMTESIIQDTDGLVLQGEAVHYELTHRVCGTFISFDIMKTPIRDAQGHITGICGLSRDITKHERAEEALKQSEERYRTILEEIEDGYQEVDLSGNFTFFNESFCKIFGYSKNELLGSNFRRYAADEETADRVYRAYNQMYKTGNPLKRFEWDIINKDGTRRSIEFFASLLRDGEGHRRGFRGIVRDVTDRKFVEEQYRTMANSSQTGVYIVQDGRLCFVNPHIPNYSGYPEEELIGEQVLHFVHPDDRKMVREMARKMLAGELTAPYEYRIVDKNNQVRWLMETVTPISYKGRSAVLGNTMDTTERKWAEERYRSIFENAQEGIFQTTHEGRYLTANQALAAMLGYDSPEDLITTVINIPKQLYLNPEDRKVLLKMIEEQGPVRGFETQFYRKNGSMIWVSVNQQAVRDAGGHLLYYEGFNEDITIKKEGIERIKKALGATVQAMAVTVETRDPYTAGHQRRVADLSRSIATEMNLPADQIDGIRMAAIIHDLGKISVPAEILSKPTRLTALEFSLIKTHSQSGYDILKDIDFPWPIARMVLEHHERMDGSGYPQGLIAEEALLESQILAVADVVESMASHRPYRPALGIDAAVKEIENNRGTLYDNAVADACLRLFREKGYQLQ